MSPLTVSLADEAAKVKQHILKIGQILSRFLPKLMVDEVDGHCLDDYCEDELGGWVEGPWERPSQRIFESHKPINYTFIPDK